MATRRRTTPKAPDPWRNRIVESGVMPARDIMAHPSNPRIHPLDQRGAIVAVFDQVGWVMRVIINKPTGKLIDGHLRVEVAADRGEDVPYDMVDLTDEEERIILATIDPIGQMATFDTEMMTELTDGLEMDAALRAALSGIVHFEADEEATAPTTVTLKPLSRAHVLISVPLDLWDTVSDVLDQLDEIDGVEINSTVN